jgi:uncharacterized protein (TIGR03437 family)
MQNYAGLGALVAVSLLGQNLAPPPWVRQGGVFNAASQLTTGIPGGSIAPGALIAIEGLRFVPSDVAVEIDLGGRVYPAAVLTSTTERIIARMPVFRNSGVAKLFVRSRGKRSSGSDLRLAPSAFGIYTANGKGWGMAASVADPNDSPKELAPVSVPGRVTLSGTGLGRAAERAIEVYVADRKASQVHRSEQRGIEHVSFEMPVGTPPGCAVPVIVAIGGVASNTAVLRTNGGQGCGTTSVWYRNERAPGRSSAVMVLLRSDVILELDPGKPVPFYLDNLSATFQRRMAGGPVEESPLDFIPPPGACMSYAGSLDPNALVPPILTGPAPDGPDLDLGPDIAERASSLEDMDAGPELTISGTDGTRRALRSTHKPRVYSAILGGNPPVTRIPATPLFLAPGAYRIEIPGGSDVGKASIAVNIPKPIVWRNRDAMTTLDRKAGADLEWTLPDGYTGIIFAWNINRRTSSGGLAVCVPPVRAIRFRIPPTDLANLPATIVSASDLSLGFLGVAAVPIEPASVAARGVDYSRLTAASLSGRSVVVK